MSLERVGGVAGGDDDGAAGQRGGQPVAVGGGRFGGSWDEAGGAGGGVPALGDVVGEGGDLRQPGQPAVTHR
ncbi:hypothetical protein GCM10020001_006340 [Nonomuraea salmonea]